MSGLSPKGAARDCATHGVLMRPTSELSDQLGIIPREMLRIVQMDRIATCSAIAARCGQARRGRLLRICSLSFAFKRHDGRDIFRYMYEHCSMPLVVVV